MFAAKGASSGFSRIRWRLVFVFVVLVGNRGLTVVMVTHEKSFAERASRQIDLQDGAIIADRRAGR